MPCDESVCYKIHFTKTSLKEFQKLGATVKEQFKKKLKSLQANPHVDSARLSDELAGCYKIKLRASGYRLVYQVKDDRLIIIVIGVDKRQSVYDKMLKRLPVEVDDTLQ
ncbi:MULTISPECIES: type II toxin-antitoxin system RelE family toxin [unclassified Moraxella]|uniref:type II toxin-antitoxin system RelE family toxin n=1 Tax=unclassified Moraxella TaxID=2685852 RepID=UPI003AF722B1